MIEIAKRTVGKTQVVTEITPKIIVMSKNKQTIISSTKIHANPWNLIISAINETYIAKAMKQITLKIIKRILTLKDAAFKSVEVSVTVGLVNSPSGSSCFSL